MDDILEGIIINLYKQHNIYTPMKPDSEQKEAKELYLKKCNIDLKVLMKSIINES